VTVEDAPLGIADIEKPAIPLRLWAAIQKAKRG